MRTKRRRNKMPADKVPDAASAIANGTTAVTKELRVKLTRCDEFGGSNGDSGQQKQGGRGKAEEGSASQNEKQVSRSKLGRGRRPKGGSAPQNEDSGHSSDDVQETREQEHLQDSELSDTASAKRAPNPTAKGRKRKKEEDDAEREDTRSAKAQKKDSDKAKSSREKIPDVSSMDFGNDSQSPSGDRWNFKIASWNVNGIRAWLEKEGLSYLRHEDPDVICIQETKCSDDKMPGELREVEGYRAYWLSGDKDGYSGVGLLTKQEPITVEYGIGMPEHDNEGRVITAEYDKFYLVAAYVPNAGRKLVRLDYRMQWDRDFRAYLKKLDAKKPVILCGDLNVAHQEIDLANPKTNKRNAGFTQEERDGFSDLLREGFTDAFRHLYPDARGAYTFWTYMMNARAKNVGWRLDYFVISERLCERLCDSVIRKDVAGSDHCPVALFLSL